MRVRGAVASQSHRAARPDKIDQTVYSCLDLACLSGAIRGVGPMALARRARRPPGVSRPRRRRTSAATAAGSAARGRGRQGPPGDTVPRPQASVADVRTDGCRAVMVACAPAPAIDFDGASVHGGPLSQAARDAGKAGRRGEPREVVKQSGGERRPAGSSGNCRGRTRSFRWDEWSRGSPCVHVQGASGAIVPRPPGVRSRATLRPGMHPTTRGSASPAAGS